MYMYIIYCIQFFLLYIPGAQHTFCSFRLLRIMLQFKQLINRKYKNNFTPPQPYGKTFLDSPLKHGIT